MEISLAADVAHIALLRPDGEGCGVLAAGAALQPAAIGAAAALFTLVGGAWTAKRREHQAWLRQSRLELYAGVAEEALAAYDTSNRPNASRSADYYEPIIQGHIDRLQSLTLRMRIVGEAGLSEMADRLLERCESLISFDMDPDLVPHFQICPDRTLQPVIATFIDRARRDVDGDGSWWALGRRKMRWRKADNQFRAPLEQGSRTTP